MQLPTFGGVVTGNDKAIHVSFAREFFKDIATKHFSGQVAEGVTEQAAFPMSPNERLLFGMWPKVGKSRRTLGHSLKATLPCEDVCIFPWGVYCNVNFGMVEFAGLTVWQHWMRCFSAFDVPTKGCLLKQAMEHLLGIGAALLPQHRLNATCSNRLLTPLKPHAHTLMYKSAAASVSCDPSDLVPTEHEPSKGGLGVLRTLGIQSGDERQKGDFKTSIYFGQTSWSSYSVSRKPWLFKAFHVAFSNSMSAKMMLELAGWQIEAWANQSSIFALRMSYCRWLVMTVG